MFPCIYCECRGEAIAGNPQKRHVPMNLDAPARTIQKLFEISSNLQGNSQAKNNFGITGRPFSFLMNIPNYHKLIIVDSLVRGS